MDNILALRCFSIRNEKAGKPSRLYLVFAGIPAHLKEMQRISRPRLSIITVYPFEEETDPDGDIALSHESNYYVEGMSYTDSEDRETRIQCFQAAETLYLHAAAKGNVIVLEPTRPTRTQRESASGSIRGRPTRNLGRPRPNLRVPSILCRRFLIQEMSVLPR